AEATASPPKTDTAPGEPAAKPAAPVDVRNLQDKFNSLIEGRNQSNDLARGAADERNLLNEARRTKSQELEVHKAARDAANEVKGKEAELKQQKTVEIDLSDTDGSIDGFFAKADEEHAKVVAALKEAQGHHEKFIAGVKEVRTLVSEANKKHAEFVAHKLKAD